MVTTRSQTRMANANTTAVAAHTHATFTNRTQIKTRSQTRNNQNNIIRDDNEIIAAALTLLSLHDHDMHDHDTQFDFTDYADIDWSQIKNNYTCNIL